MRKPSLLKLKILLDLVTDSLLVGRVHHPDSRRPAQLGVGLGVGGLVGRHLGLDLSSSGVLARLVLFLDVIDQADVEYLSLAGLLWAGSILCPAEVVLWLIALALHLLDVVVRVILGLLVLVLLWVDILVGKICLLESLVVLHGQLIVRIKEAFAAHHFVLSPVSAILLLV